MRCGVCHATLTVRGYRIVNVGNSNNGKRRVPLYHPCPRLGDATFHPARSQGTHHPGISPRPLNERIARAEALSSRYLGNYNAEMEAGRTKGAEKMLAKSQYWLDVANNLRGNA